MDSIELLVQNIDWWLYVIFVCFVFAVILSLYYVVKKFNEEPEESAKTPSKPSIRQSILYRNKEVKKPSTVTPPDNIDSARKLSSRRGISLVFNKEDKHFEDNIKKEMTVPERTPVTPAREISREKYLQSVPLSDRSSANSTKTTEEAKPASQQDRQDGIDKLEQNEEINESVDTSSKTCHNKAESPKVIRNNDEFAIQQNKEINESVETCVMPCNNKAESPKVARNNDEFVIQMDDIKKANPCNIVRSSDNNKKDISKTNTDKLEHNKYINEIVEPCKMCRDKSENSKVVSKKNKKGENNKDVDENMEICKTCYNKAENSKVEQNKDEISIQIDDVETANQDNIVKSKENNKDEVKTNVDEVDHNKNEIDRSIENTKEKQS